MAGLPASPAKLPSDNPKASPLDSRKRLLFTSTTALYPEPPRGLGLAGWWA
jgi:hypothetical protein